MGHVALETACCVVYENISVCVAAVSLTGASTRCCEYVDQLVAFLIVCSECD
jgi:hypothetical protein